MVALTIWADEPRVAVKDYDSCYCHRVNVFSSIAYSAIHIYRMSA